MVMTPTIHLNGTSAQALVEQQHAVLRHLTAARDALIQAAPHGRDFYPQGPGAIEQALAGHYERLERLDSMRDELTEIAMSIGAETRRRRAA